MDVEAHLRVCGDGHHDRPVVHVPLHRGLRSCRWGDESDSTHAAGRAQDVFGNLGVIALIPIVLLFGMGVLTTKNFNNLDCTCVASWLARFSRPLAGSV